MKTATVKLQIKRARLQLAQRKELGEMLHVIDFEKLRIENQDFAKLLEEKNLYVIDMKKIAGDRSREICVRDWIGYLYFLRS